MSKIMTKYVCQSCGYMSPRWTGKCPNCNEWNTFVEEAPTPAKIARKSGGVASKIEPVALNDVAVLRMSVLKPASLSLTGFSEEDWYPVPSSCLAATPASANRH